MKTSEVLYRAAYLIEERGWTKGVRGLFVDGASPRCLMGSIGETYGESCILAKDAGFYSFTLVGETAAAKAIGEHIGYSDLSRLWAWNDAPERTGDEVIAVLKAAAVIEAARETVSAREQVAS